MYVGTRAVDSRGGGGEAGGAVLDAFEISTYSPEASFHRGGGVEKLVVVGPVLVAERANRSNDFSVCGRCGYSPFSQTDLTATAGHVATRRVSGKAVAEINSSCLPWPASLMCVFLNDLVLKLPFY